MTLRNLSRGLIILGILAVAVAWPTAAQAQPTTVSGTVTNADGQGVSFVRVRLLRADSGPSSFLESPSTGPSGEFTISNVPGGTYFAVTANSSGLINRARGNGSGTVVFVGGSTVGTYQGLSPLSVQGTPITGVNFQLFPGATISGTITAAGGGSVSFASARFMTADGFEIGTAGAGPDTGAYTSPGLPPGTYRVRTSNSSGFVDQVHPATTCLNCPADAGTAITVGASGNTPGINFALVAGGSISGTVTNSSTGNPVGNVSMQIVNSANESIGKFASSHSTNGTYSFTGLPAGNYFVRTQNSVGLLDEVFNNVLCSNCNPTTTGTAIVVTAGVASTGIDFALAPGGSISGRVSNASTNADLSGIRVDVYSLAGAFVSGMTTNATGNYTVSGLTAGSYRVKTVGMSSFLHKAYNDIPCTNCSNTTGDIVTVTAGVTTTGINFALVQGGSISGKVTNASTGANVQGISVSVYSLTGTFMNGASTNATGDYTVSGLAPGSYRVKTTGMSSFLHKAYNDIPCTNCSNTTGDIVTVTGGVTTTGINFALVQGGSISGKVTSAATGANIQGISVSVYSLAGTFVNGMSTNATGDYTVSSLAPGSYRVKTVGMSSFLHKAYNDIPCANCSNTTGDIVTVTAGVTTTGISFALVQGGSISGKVTNATTGANVQGISVSVYSLAGTFVSNMNTNATGDYTISSLAPGSYRVKTVGTSSFIHKAYNDIPCPSCSNTTGDIVTVTAGVTTTGINFALVQGGSISGKVTHAVTGENLSGIGVSVYSTTGSFVRSASSNASGDFTVLGVPAGSYHVKTSTFSGFINKAYDNIQCANCSNTTGTLVPVTAGVTTGNINFALSPGATITGEVRNSQDVPLMGVTVLFVDGLNTLVGTATTNASGVYSRNGLVPGTYYARTSNTQGLVNQIYDGTTCVFCSVVAGTPITVTGSATVSGINFQLGAGGGISGTVTGPGATPLTGISVQIYGVSGSLIETRTTNAEGHYATGTGLPAGQYFVRTRNAPGLVDTLYQDILCLQCDPLMGQPVVVAEATVTTGVNLALTAGASISGVVRSQAGNAPLQNVLVTVHAADGTQVTQSNTTASGEYQTGVLPAGTYYVRTGNAIGYIDQLHAGQPCVNCNPTTGTPVIVAGTPVTDINFLLTEGGRISGTVRSEDGTPIGGIAVQVLLPSGVHVANGSTNGSGEYTVGTGLQDGLYYARTLNVSGYVDKVYNGLPCEGPECEVISGTPITVVTGAHTTNIDFTLATGARIAGRITDSVTGLGIGGAFVNVYTSTGKFANQVSADGEGRYITRFAVAPGTYFVRAASRLGYISKVWDNIDCVACSPLTGTEVTVVGDATVSDINFALTPGRRLSGVVTDAATGAPLSDMAVQVYDRANNLVTTAYTDGEGRYMSASGLRPGSYFVRTSQAYNVEGDVPPAPTGIKAYVDQLFGGTVCVGCVPNTGTAVVIGAETDVTGINFALTVGARIEGTVVDEVTGRPLYGAKLDVWDVNGKVIDRSRADASGRYATQGGLPPGTYYVLAEGANYVNKVYNNTECVGCDPRIGTPVVVAGPTHVTGINFTMVLGGAVRGTVRAADTGLPLGNVRVVAYSTTGSYIGETVTDAAGRFEGGGLAAGSYLVRTFNLSGYVDQAHSGLTCAPCDLLNATPVVVTTGVTMTGLDFVLARGGLVSGYAADRDTKAALPGVTVTFLSNGIVIGQAAPTNEFGYYAISLPVGRYRAVTNAVNGYATSGASTPVAKGMMSSVSSMTTLNQTASDDNVTVALGEVTTGVTFALASCVAPTFFSTTLPMGRVGSAYAQAVMASGGTGALTYSIADGLLPPGLTLATATGAVIGNPTVAGTAAFTLGVSDSNGCAATVPFFLTVQAALPTPLENQLRSEVFVTGLNLPVGFVQDPSQANVQYVLEQFGRIRVVQNGVVLASPFLDLSSVVVAGGEQGLLGMAFAPDYAESRRFYVHFTGAGGHSVIARFRRDGTDPLRADPVSRFDLVFPGGQAFITQPFANHNGGDLHFGPDGYLYIALGDGGGSNDPLQAAQDMTSLLGKVLRIDVAVPDTDVSGYRIPTGNPFHEGSVVSALPGAFSPASLIWSRGWRNPWRFTIDDVAVGGRGALVAGDVGQSAWEEINYEPAGRGGRNYGWRIREGAHPNPAFNDPTTAGLTDPVIEYAHAVGATVIGGRVYRGTGLGLSYFGHYFFADMNGRLWSASLTIDQVSGEVTASSMTEHTAGLAQTSGTGVPVAFGTDAQCRLHVVDYTGRILRLLPPSGDASSTCATPDPFRAMGGGVWVGNGWVPANHPLAQSVVPPPSSGPPTPPAPPVPPSPVACVGSAPGSEWVCVNGGWLPPNHPLAQNVVTPPPSPDPPVPPSPTVCVGPDPFVGIPGIRGVCINGGWVPVVSGGRD